MAKENLPTTNSSFGHGRLDSPLVTSDAREYVRALKQNADISKSITQSIK